MELTLQWLIEESDLTGIRLLSCKDHVTNQICGVNIMDNPDTVRWIKKGELVLTTGYVFCDNPVLQESIIADLQTAGCAALCIKTKRFLDVVPETMLQASERVGLPIIELPTCYSLSDISEEVTRHLFQQQFQDAIKEQTLLNTLFNCYFQRNSMDEILRILAEYLGCSVFILDDNAPRSWFALSAADKTLYQEGSELQFKVLSSRARDSRVLFQGVTRTAALLPFSSTRYALCVLYDPASEPNWGTISQALMILDFSRNNTSIKQSRVMNYYDSFFHYLMSEENFSESYELQISGYYGLPQPCSCVCVLVRLRDKDAAALKYTVNEYERQLHASSLPKDSYFIAWNNSQICICFFKPHGRKEYSYHDLRQLVEETAASDSAIYGISRPSAVPLRQAYKEASLMLSLARLFPEQRAFCYQDYLLFANIANMTAEEKQNIYRMTIQPLIEYDKEYNAGLTETLMEYYKCHLNARLAASRLYIHRNTFLNRMDRIESLIEFHTDDPNNMFSVYYGLCIYLFDHASMDT